MSDYKCIHVPLLLSQNKKLLTITLVLCFTMVTPVTFKLYHYLKLQKFTYFYFPGLVKVCTESLYIFSSRYIPMFSERHKILSAGCTLSLAVNFNF